MKFKLYQEYGALNSKPAFDAFAKGVINSGHQIVNENEDVSVIWSVLWKGRMKSNEFVYQQAKKTGKKICIIEVGNLKRGTTWRISFDNINKDGFFGDTSDLDLERPKKLGIELNSEQLNRKKEILICTQLPESLQWKNMPSIDQWVDNTIKDIRQYTDRKIVVRYHPRHILRKTSPNFQIEIPKKIPNTYDDFDIDYNFHVVVNYNSGPAVQAAIFGTPVVCHTSSLAYPVSIPLSSIENPHLPDRQDWFLRLSHTEWTLDEIAYGAPISRLLK